jgi:copper(I)-binding protein
MKHAVAALLLLAAWAAGVSRAGASPTIVVSDVWSRPATVTGVVYATFHNTGPATDRLVGASSPAATHVELHESFASTMPAMSMGNMSMGNASMGTTGMKSIPWIPVPAGGTKALKPGGYHLMLDLRHDLHAGETIPLNLHFARAGWISASARVRAM